MDCIRLFGFSLTCRGKTVKRQTDRQIMPCLSEKAPEKARCDSALMKPSMDSYYLYTSFVYCKSRRGQYVHKQPRVRSRVGEYGVCFQIVSCCV